MRFAFRWIRWLLLPLGAIHLLIIWLRNRLYDTGLMPQKLLSRPVISVGNVQMGGTGKTPVSLGILEMFAGDPIGVLTRGYGRNSSEPVVLAAGQAVPADIEIGDEPRILHAALKRGAVGIGADRVAMGTRLLEHREIRFFLLDDGLQHRRLRRDLDICLIEVAGWPRHPFLFPFSTLRDEKRSLARAGCIILSLSEDHRERAGILEGALRKRYDVPVMKALYRFRSPQHLSGVAVAPGTDLTGRPVAAACGIAGPQRFFGMLRRSGFTTVIAEAYPDHHNFSRREVEVFQKSALEQRASAILITEKDAVKWRLLEGVSWRLPVYVMPVSLELDDPGRLKHMIEDLVGSGEDGGGAGRQGFKT